MSQGAVLTAMIGLVRDPVQISPEHLQASRMSFFRAPIELAYVGPPLIHRQYTIVLTGGYG